MPVALFLAGLGFSLVAFLFWVMTKEKEYKQSFEDEMMERAKKHPYVKIMEDAVQYAKDNKEKLKETFRTTSKEINKKGD